VSHTGCAVPSITLNTAPNALLVSGSRALATRADAASRPVTRSGGVGAECDSVCARLFECQAADDKGLR